MAKLLVARSSTSGNEDSFYECDVMESGKQGTKRTIRSDSSEEVPKSKKKRKSKTLLAESHHHAVASSNAPSEPTAAPKSSSSSVTFESNSTKALASSSSPSSSSSNSMHTATIASGGHTSAGNTSTKAASAPSSSKSKSKSKSNSADSSSQVSEAVVCTSTSAAVVTGTVAKKPQRAKAKSYYLKPYQGKSWLPHIATLLVQRCVEEAIRHRMDPRSELELGNLEWAGPSRSGFLSSSDLTLLWHFIKKEYQDKPLKEISTELKPLTHLTISDFMREDVRLKFKDQMPKAPPSAYMLFTKVKGPKLKEKHPNLLQTEVAVKLGKKWKSMGAEKQEKYKRQYQVMRLQFGTELEQFYEEHPDAKPLPAHSSAGKKKSKEEKQREIELSWTDEERRIHQLKSIAPKAPISPYLLFCKAKREYYHRIHPALGSKEVTSKLGESWRNMSVSKRSKYQKMNARLAEEYKLLLKQFYAENPDAEELLAKSRKRKAPANPKQQNTVATAVISKQKEPLPATRNQSDSEEEGGEEEEEDEEEEEEEEEEGGDSGEESGDSDSSGKGSTGILQPVQVNLSQQCSAQHVSAEEASSSESGSDEEASSNSDSDVTC